MRWARNTVERHPLACLAFAALAGILCMDGMAGPAARHGAFIVALTFGLWTCWRPTGWRLAVATAAGFAFIHACGLDATRTHPLTTVLEPGKRVDVLARGVFTRAPMGVEASRTPGRREARFLAQSVVIPSLGHSIEGDTSLRVWLRDEKFVPGGGPYELRGTLSLPSPAVNPSLYDPQRGAQRRGIVADLTPREITPPDPPEFSPWLWLLTLSEQSRQWIKEAVAKGIENDEMPRTLVQIMALGLSEAGSTDLQEPFRDTGTLHVFAVSGLHVSMLAWIGWVILRSLGLRKGLAACVLIPMVLGYAFMTGWRPSAARAALMTVAMLCAPLVDRRSRSVNVLGGTALLVWAADTQQLYLAGFQLSFGVVWFLAVAVRPLARPFDKHARLDPFLPPQLADWRQRFSVWWRRELLAMLAMSIVAWAASLPIMLLEFHSVTPISVLANLVLVPLSFISLFTVVLSLITARLGLVALQVLFNNANWLLAHAMMTSATWFAAIPGGNFAVAMPTPSPVPAVVMNVLAMPPGEASQLLNSRGQHWLLDCGGAKHENTGILPFLREQGVNSLDGVVLSHADSGHIGALQDLMPRFHPPLVMMSMHEPWRLDSRITLMHRLFSSHVLDSARITKLKAGDTFAMGAAQVHVLYPGAADLYNKSDDRAIVARIDCGKMRLLWCNDAGFITEKHLLARCPPQELRSHVIIRDQHASDFSALPEFVLAVGPKLVVSSNAPGIVEQRLPEHLSAICEAHDIHLFDQAQTGMVKLDIWPDHLEAKAWLTGESVSIVP